MSKKPKDYGKPAIMPVPEDLIKLIEEKLEEQKQKSE